MRRSASWRRACSGNIPYFTADKTFCIYLAVDEAAIRDHAKLSGFPASRITEVACIVDPTTALAA